MERVPAAIHREISRLQDWDLEYLFCRISFLSKQYVHFLDPSEYEEFQKIHRAFAEAHDMVPDLSAMRLLCEQGLMILLSHGADIADSLSVGDLIASGAKMAEDENSARAAQGQKYSPLVRSVIDNAHKVRNILLNQGDNKVIDLNAWRARKNK